MLIEGIFLHILIVKVFHDHLPKKRFYVTFCWGRSNFVGAYCTLISFHATWERFQRASTILFTSTGNSSEVIELNLFSKKANLKCLSISTFN